MRVSVITPFYKGNDYITAYQAMMQANEDNLSAGDELEVIIVNDSPGIKVMLSGTNATKNNWHVIKNTENMGIHASRVHGLEAATGDYVIFLDQDDILREDAVATILQKVRTDMDDNHTIYVANACLEQRDSEAIWYRTDYHKAVVGDFQTYLHIGTQIISPGQCLIPKDVIPEYWKTHICGRNGADDYFLWILLLNEGIPFEVIDEVLYRHHFTEQNLSADTTVTDNSSYEFISFLREDGEVRTADLDTLEHMLRFKAAFRRASKVQKLMLAFKHPLFMLDNLYFKARTHTGYGFNR